MSWIFSILIIVAFVAALIIYFKYTGFFVDKIMSYENESYKDIIVWVNKVETALSLKPNFNLSSLDRLYKIADNIDIRLIIMVLEKHEIDTSDEIRGLIGLRPKYQSRPAPPPPPPFPYPKLEKLMTLSERSGNPNEKRAARRAIRKILAKWEE